MSGPGDQPWIGRAELEALLPGARASALASLRTQIDDRLVDKCDGVDFERETAAIITELTAVGHDL